MAAKTDVAGRRAKTKGEAPLASYVDKDITPTMEAFVAYIKEQTGYDADPRSVQLSGVLRGKFQKSESNQERLAARKREIEAEAEARIARAEERAQRKADKEAARAAKAAEPKAEKAAKPAAKAATKKAAAAPAAKKGAAKTKVAPVTRRRPVGGGKAKGAAESDF